MKPFQQPREDRVNLPEATPVEQQPLTESPPPPVGVTPPQVLARAASEGRRGAAWRLLHWIMEGDPRAYLAVSSLEDDRLAVYLLEFVAAGTWAGKPFVVPGPLRSPLARAQLRALFLAGSGMDAQRAERVLVAGLDDGRPAVRENAVHILGLLGSARAAEPLIKALKDPVMTVRMQAVKALGRIGKAEAVPALLGTLRASDEQFSGQVCDALVHIGPAGVPFLLKEINSPSTWIRWHCVRALGAICDYRALPSLVNALRDSDHSVAWLAAKGLARYGKWCVGPVLNLLATTETSAWLAETASYVLRDVYVHDQALKPYLEPVVRSMHDVAYNIGAPNAARKALAQLVSNGLIAVPS